MEIVNLEDGKKIRNGLETKINNPHPGTSFWTSGKVKHSCQRSFCVSDMKIITLEKGRSLITAN